MDDNEQALFFKGLAGELRCWNSTYNAQLQFHGVARLLNKEQNVGRIASHINLAIYTDRQPRCREVFMDGQYIDIIAVHCTLPNNFQMCMAFDNGLCFSGCGTCNTSNSQQQVQADSDKPNSLT